MAIYGDSKHNENMEHTPSKYEVIDQVIYRTVYFTVEADNGKVYNVSLAEDDWHDDWKVMDEDSNELNDDTDLFDELVTLCEEKLKA
jgi:hypothetical protein